MDPTDRSVVQTRKLLLATFIRGRDPAVVPPFGSHPIGRPMEARTPEDLAAWTAALGGKTPKQVSDEFIQEGLIEPWSPPLNLMLPGQPGRKGTGQVTPTGAVIVREFFYELETTEWQVESKLGKSKVAEALKWVASSAVGGVIATRGEELYQELIKLLGDAARAAKTAVEVKMTEFEQLQQLKNVTTVNVPTQREGMISVDSVPEAAPNALDAPVMGVGTGSVLSVSLIAARVRRWFRQRHRH